jgi:molybdopterin/thiamine biosynthesis adenylyltransferase
MGGVGGAHLITLARLGVGKFSIADADTFGCANFNRQYGATTNAMGCDKVTVMADHARTINPELDLRVFNQFINDENIDEFLTDVDILVDSVDFFSFDARRRLFNEARRRGIWAITAGPIGFSTAWLVFDPNGMSFDEYFDLNDRMSETDKLISFGVGLTPKALQSSYIDLSKIDLATGAAPSVGLACQFASGVVASEVAKIISGTGTLRPAPYFQQFDAKRMKLAKGKLRFGNRGPLQQAKRWLLRRLCKSKGVMT